MSSSLQLSSSSTPNFQPIFEQALEEYKNKTGNDLTAHPLAAEINGCGSPNAILTVLEGKANELEHSRSSDERLTKSLISTVTALHVLSITLGEGVGLIILSAMGILIVAAKGAAAHHDVLVELFARIERFLGRLKIFSKVPPSSTVTDELAKLMADVLLILAIATKGIKERRLTLKKEAGINDLDDALQRLGGLEQRGLPIRIAQGSSDPRVLTDLAKEIKADTAEMKAMVKNIVKRMDARDWEGVLQKLKKWLSPPDPSVSYNIGLRCLHEETAIWFLDSPIFQEWHSAGSLLWIDGKPGSGKSIFCSAIIQHILSLSDGGRASVAYFYFDFRDENKKHLHNLLPSLLFQFASSIPCCEILSRVYSTHGNGTRQPGDEAPMKCLTDMLFAMNHHPIYIIVDALDESPSTSSERSPRELVLTLIAHLFNLRLPNLHMCMTSRLEMDILFCLEPFASHRISLQDQTGHKKGIAKYINSEVGIIADENRWQKNDKKPVIETLSEKADGIFRWAFCQVEMLKLCSRTRVQQHLNQLSDRLDETYERILNGIHRTNRGDVQRLLQCLAVAIRPLQVDEVAAILTFDPSASMGEVPTLDADSQLEEKERKVLSACPILITIVGDHNSRLVHFSHFSVKEFLMSDRLSNSREDISRYHILPEAAHTTLAQVSLGILLRLDHRIDRRNVTKIPLARYAARYWVSHAQVGSVFSRIMDAMKTLFDSDKPHFAAWVRIYDIDSPSSWCSRWNAQRPFYYSVICGFYDLVEHLLEKLSPHINTIGGSHDYPLVAALHGGNIRIAELLRQHGADLDVQGTKDGLLLHRAIEWPGNLAVGAAQFLLTHGADVAARRTDLSTPLHLAADQGKFEVAQMLLQHGADINSRNIGGKTPLHLAAVQGHFEMAQMLLQRGAAINAQNIDGETPLQFMLQPTFPWSEGDRLNLIRLLLEHGAEVNSQNKSGATALHNGSNLEVAQVLLAHGANVNAKDNRGRTPLLWVLENTTPFDIAKLLVENGADVNARDNDHETPLHLASYSLKPKIVRMLLDRGADVHAMDRKEQSPLHRASEVGHFIEEDRFGIAQMLVEHGADAKTRNKNRETWLHLASRSLKLKLVQILLDHGANVDAEDYQGQTPLHQGLLKADDYYLSDEYFCVAQVLVEHGANLNARGQDEETLLHLASYFLEPNLVRVLLSHGAYINAEDDFGRTPLHRLFWEAEDYSDEDFFCVAQLLLERGAVLSTRDKIYETPLHLACYSPEPKLVQMLLDCGANVNAADNRGRTPLHRVFLEAKYYSDDEFFDLTQLLVERGADVNAQDQDHATPLHLVSYFPKVKFVQLLLDHGTNVNAVDSQGRTPLLRLLGAKGFSDEDCFSVAQLLVEHGADVQARDEDRVTPLHLASYFLELKLVRMLLDHGANVNAEDRRDRTPFHRVLEDGGDSDKDRLGVSHLLIEHGADVNKPDNDREAPLHLASRLLSFEVAWVLLEHGADVLAKGKEGKTPLKLARESVAKEIRRSPTEYSLRRAQREKGVALMGLLFGYY